MPTYTTRALAEALDIEGTPKQATRELRKFLRATTPRDEQPGKGGRYALDLTKRDITKMKKNFIAWHAEQEEARKARTEAKKAESDKAPKTDDEPIEDDADMTPEGDEPTEQDIDDMIRELAEEDTEA